MSVGPLTRPRLIRANAPWLVQLLARFRKDVESGVDEPLEEVVVPAVLLLDDLCSRLSLSESDRQAVLGQQGVAAVERILSQTYSVMEPEAVLRETSGPSH